ncbi:LysR family transcriptional regulator [Paenibacillus sp. MBLB4367]|uniref:LysR family transcriptional regulator n=1 Tax=Paenibacillus sp. MBLB4367 TaxID=3384767 RepID=UPI0039082F96
MIANMDWYRVFYFTAKAGSLSKAAEQLFITQPAVSHSIKQLESKLGGALFFRTPKGVKLTAEGEVLFKYVEQAYNFVETAEKKIAEMHLLLAGELRIGAGDTLCKHFLLPYLSSFHQSYPQVNIQVTNRTTKETVSLLKEGKIDLGIVNLPLPAADSMLAVQASIPIRDGFVAGERYKHLAGKPLPLPQFRGLPLIMLEQGSASRRYVDRFFLSHDIVLQPEIELGSVDLLTDFARSGFGIACVIEDFVDTGSGSGSPLYPIRLELPIPPRNVGLITLKDVPLSPAAKQLIALLP